MAEGKFIDIFFHRVTPANVPAFREMVKILAEFAPSLEVVPHYGADRVRYNLSNNVLGIPLAPLADEAPLYDRPYVSREHYKAWAAVKPLGEVPESADIGADLLRLMACPDLASRRWIWQQYDSPVGADTRQLSGGAAA